MSACDTVSNNVSHGVISLLETVTKTQQQHTNNNKNNNTAFTSNL